LRGLNLRHKSIWLPGRNAKPNTGSSRKRTLTPCASCPAACLLADDAPLREAMAASRYAIGARGLWSGPRPASNNAVASHVQDEDLDLPPWTVGPEEIDRAVARRPGIEPAALKASNPEHLQAGKNLVAVVPSGRASRGYGRKGTFDCHLRRHSSRLPCIKTPATVRNYASGGLHFRPALGTPSTLFPGDSGRAAEGQEKPTGS